MPSRYKYFSDGVFYKLGVSCSDYKKFCNKDRDLISSTVTLLDHAAGRFKLPDKGISASVVDGKEILFETDPVSSLAIMNILHPRPVKPKTYYLDPKIRRKLSSSAARMWLQKKPGENVIFITLTFPDYPGRASTNFNITEAEANICWSKFVENLRKNYKLSGYIATKELTNVGRPHYHCILRLPFQDLMKMNDAWVHTFPNGMQYSSCALRTDKKKGPKVKNIRRAVGYCCKYLLKGSADGVVYSERCHFMSHDIIDKGQFCSKRFIDFLLSEVETQKKEVFVWRSENYPVEIYTIKGYYRVFDDICQQMLNSS